VQKTDTATPGRGKGIMLPNLKRERHRAGLTLRELEKVSGVKNTTISELENGRRGAQGRTVRKLAEALGVTPKDLVG
jgi:transcriptional regulator with XRE-family HTH domain